MKTKLISFISIALLVYSCTTLEPINSKEISKIDSKYTFTADWFSHHISNWTLILRYMKSKPNQTYLEIGVYEGRSFFWVLDNILIHPSSKAIAIDIFSGEDEQRFLDNMRRSGHSSKISVIKGFSQEKIRNLKLNSFDLIYIDGDHRSKGVLMDVMMPHTTDQREDVVDEVAHGIEIGRIHHRPWVDHALRAMRRREGESITHQH